MAIEARTPGLGSAWKFWAMVFGALFSIPALISVIQRVFKLGLVQIIQDALTTYRKLYYPLFQFASSYFLAVFFTKWHIGCLCREKPIRT